MKNFNLKNTIATFFLTVILVTGLTSLSLANSSINADANAERYSYSKTFRVNAEKIRNHQFKFYAGEKVEIGIEGDGYTNLDLYVYDEAGNLCAKRTGQSDYETITLNIYRTNVFTVKVVNRGEDFNDYDLNIEAY